LRDLDVDGRNTNRM